MNVSAPQSLAWTIAVAILTAGFFIGSVVTTAQFRGSVSAQIDVLEHGLDELDQWRHEINVLRETRDTRIRALETQVATLATDISAIKNSLTRVEKLLDGGHK